MKKQKKDKRRQSTQQLMGIQKITDYCISTDAGDLVFYIVRPSNLGVLPANAIYARIEALKNVLSTQANIELLALNSRESFTQNRAFYHDRLQQETNPEIRRLLEQDRQHLDEMQVEMKLAREFYLVVRLKDEKRETVYCFFPPSRNLFTRAVFLSAEQDARISSASLHFILKKTRPRSGWRTTTVSGFWRDEHGTF